jgi:exonuclease III
MRVMSWNLNARRERLPDQVDAVRAVAPDVAAFQEVTDRSWQALRPLLAGAGLVHGLTGAGQAGEQARPAYKRWVAVVSRWPLVPCEPCPEAYELVVCATVLRPDAPFDLIAVHVPTRANGVLEKTEVQEEIVRRLAQSDGRPLVLCGDFNSPKAETEAGEIVAFVGPRGGRALAAELALLQEPPARGMADVFRATNGYQPTDCSWHWKNRGKAGGYRLDHVFASTSLAPSACWYAHELREQGLSDHAPIVADFAPPQQAS